MAGVNLDIGRGGRRAVDVVIPLVPFLDVLAMMVTFLIMTAVWTQIGAMQVGSQGQGGGTAPALRLELTITGSGFWLDVDGDRRVIPATGGAHDLAALRAALGTVKEDHPAQTAIHVAAEDAIAYELLVQAVDACIAADLPEITVTAAAG